MPFVIICEYKSQNKEQKTYEQYSWRTFCRKRKVESTA